MATTDSPARHSTAEAPGEQQESREGLSPAPPGHTPEAGAAIPHIPDAAHLTAMLRQRGVPEKVFEAAYHTKQFLEDDRMVLALATHPDAPSHIAATLLARLPLFDLVKVCQLAGVSPDLKATAERSIIQRIPGQPLGNRVTLAHRGTAAVVEALLREGNPRVVEACLENPHLKEGAVHRFIVSPQSTPETISMVARHGRWKGKPNIRLAILKNPRTPAVWYTVFLAGMSRSTLRDLLAAPRLTAAQKDLVRQALGRPEQRP